MSIWDNIIKYYETMSIHPREGQIWEEMRYNCRETLRLIPDIRKHPKLQSLKPQLAVMQLRLINTNNGKTAQLLNNIDGSIEVSLFHISEGINFDEHTLVQAEFKNIIEILSTSLFDTPLGEE